MSSSCSQNSFLVLTIVFDPCDLYDQSCNSNVSSSNRDSVYGAVVMTKSLQEFTRFI